MKDIYDNKIYMDNRVMLDEAALSMLVEIDSKLENNPIKLAMHLNLPLVALTPIFLANSIRDPYNELNKGKVIAVPDIAYLTSEVQQGSSNKPETELPVLRLKNARLANNKITF